MKSYRKVLASGLALTLLFSQGLSSVDAKSQKKKHKEKSTQLDDKNKNGISDKWEKKYKLKGKSLAKQDSDKDGLSNLEEYQLNLNPLKADSDKDGVEDGQEDSDKDGLSNTSEIELGTDPEDADTDNDKVKDGAEKSQDGVTLSKAIKELKLEIKTADNQEIKVTYKYDKKGKISMEIEDQTNTLTTEDIDSLVSDFQDTSSLTKAQIIEKIQTILNVPLSNVKFEAEYFNGHDVEVEKENLDDTQGNKDDQQVEDQAGDNPEDQQVEDHTDDNPEDQQVKDHTDDNPED